ncbi:MAG: biotin/lipoyl-containing protein [Candidatus Fermentibacteraceae bacterium]
MPEYKVTVDGETFSVRVGRVTDHTVDVTLNGQQYTVEVEAPHRKPSKTPKLERRRVAKTARGAPERTSPPEVVASAGEGDVTSPLPGKILKLMAGKGDSVSEGQTVAVMEAMKMENEIEAPVSGTVSEVLVREGENVLENALIMRIGG